jgi:hypothetical protein
MIAGVPNPVAVFPRPWRDHFARTRRRANRNVYLRGGHASRQEKSASCDKKLLSHESISLETALD